MYTFQFGIQFDVRRLLGQSTCRHWSCTAHMSNKQDRCYSRCGAKYRFSVSSSPQSRKKITSGEASHCISM
ncbi:hypothetical protein BDZ89DRAFT_1059279 [Hymenopellis radicata]|nr:hypothetical protein BDZ89DRAFT_1059279 [Hymenopellis radicata]